MKSNWFTGLLTAAVLASAPMVQVGAAAGEDAATITHTLNRLTFAPTPGEEDRVRAMGLSAWIDRQLHPDRIDDRAAGFRPEGWIQAGIRDPKDPGAVGIRGWGFAIRGFEERM